MVPPKKSSSGSGAKAKAGAEPEEKAGRSYAVLARKYRPAAFDDLIGQEVMVRTLRNAFESGRIAQAYMLTGVRGVGKTTTARILARALNYETDEADGPTIALGDTGTHCAAIMESRHQDVIEIDAASHTGVDNIREIIDSVRYRPALARYKVYIVDEVHMLSKPAFNALLKTLEEPPEHVKFIFATTEVRKVPVTVLSRCQRFDLRRVDVDVLRDHFAKIAGLEEVEIDDEALTLIARAAEGSVRDGLSLLDQAIAHGSGGISGGDVRMMLGLADRARVFELLETVLKGDAKGALEGLRALYDDGAEPVRILTDLADAVHGITRIVAAGAVSADPTLSEAELDQARALADKLDMPALARAWQMLLKGLDETQAAPQPLAAAEMVLVRMSYLSDAPPPADLARQQPDERRDAPPAAPKGPAGNGEGARLEAGPPEPAPPPEPEPPLPDTTEVVPDAETGPAPVADTAEMPLPDSFEAVVDMVEAHRDVMLAKALIDGVHLVSYAPPHIEINLAEGASSGLANDLREFLSRETGRSWVVAVSEEAGAPTLAEKRYEEAEAIEAARAAEIEQLKSHPTVQEALKHFPDAEIADVRPLDETAETDGTPDRQDAKRSG